MPATETRESRLEAQMDDMSKALREQRDEMNLYRGNAKKTIARWDGEARGQTAGFKSAGHFLATVRDIGTNKVNANTHPQMSAWLKSTPSGMNETVGADGGFLVPPQFSQQLLSRVYDNDLLSRTTMIPVTNGNSMSVPAINEKSRVNGSRFGGVQAYWRAEAGSVTETKPSIARVDLKLEPLTLLVRATDELLEDTGFALETWLNTIASQEIGFKIGDAIVNGTGVDMPQGILKSPAKVQVSKESAQTADTIKAENIVKMWSRMYAPCRANAVWLINQDCEPQLDLMTIGTAGAQLAQYMPPGGLSASPYATLKGRPVVPTEFNATLGDAGDIILWDPSSYLTANRAGIQSAVSMHVYFSTSEQLFRFTIRMDGKCWWINPLTPYKGSNTQSCIVTLEAR